MRRKLLITIALSISLLTMLWPWFGKSMKIEDVSGLILLQNPIAFFCMIIAFVGIWTNRDYTSEMLGNIGMIGIIAMEIYEFLTWHIISISGTFDLSLSIELCYPEFYAACLCMILTFLLYRYTYKHQSLTQQFHIMDL